jgi:prophage regulatory protein
MSISKFSPGAPAQAVAQTLPAPPPLTESTILRLPAVLKERGDRSRSAHYQDIKERLFTLPVRIGARAVGWPASEVAALNAARIAGKSDQEIRVLVVKLEAARKLPYGRQL